MPKIGLEGPALAELSLDGQNLAIATPDGRLRVFPTDGGACTLNMAAGSALVPGRPDIGDRHTAICWGLLKEGRPGVFLGSASGVMKALDVTVGEIAWRIKEEGEVLDLCWSQNQLIYASGSGPTMGVINPSSGAVEKRMSIGKYGVKQIGGIPGGPLVLAGNFALTLWNVQEEKLVAKYIGHPTQVTAICFGLDGKLGFSAAEGERHVAVWNVKDPERKKNKALCTLSLDGQAKHIGALKLPGKAGKKALAVIAVSDSGIAHVWHCKVKSSLKVEATMWTRVGVVEPGRKPGETTNSPLVFADLEETPEGLAVILVYGNSSDPIFERVGLPALASEPIDLKVVRKKRGDQDAPVGSGRKKRKREVVVGPDNEGEEILMQGMGVKAVIDQYNIVSGENGDLELGAKNRSPSGRADLELPLGERIAMLEKKLSSGGATPTDETQGLNLKPDSIAVLVAQAVQSGDMNLLDVIFKKQAIKLAPSTIRRLSHKDAAGFLDMLIGRTQISTMELDVLMEWIRPILQYHAGFISSAPGMLQRISTLHQLIGVRLGRFTSILSLAGRVKLLLAQMQMRETLEQSANATTGPEAVFHIGDSGSSAEEDEEDVEAEDVNLDDARLEQLQENSIEADSIDSSLGDSENEM